MSNRIAFLLFLLFPLGVLGCKSLFTVARSGDDPAASDPVEDSDEDGDSDSEESNSNAIAPTLADDFISLTAVEISDGEISLSWQPATDDATASDDIRYDVYYSESANLGSLADIKANGLGKTQVTGTSTFQFSSLTINKNYYFAVIALDEEGNEAAYAMRSPFCDGSGVTSDEFEICDPGSLQYVYLNETAEFSVTKEIDLEDTRNWNSGAGFVPIMGFAGKIDGGGFSMGNLYINATGNEVGLFGTVTGSASLTNLSLENVFVSSAAGGMVGGLVGNVNSTSATISNNQVSGHVIGSGQVGGLIGWCQSNLSDSSASVLVEASSSSAGGLVGMAGSSITFSRVYSAGQVYSSSTDVGGLVGMAAGTTIDDSYSTANVFGSDDVGGLIGEMLLSTERINRSYASGSVHATGNNAAGLSNGVGFGVDEVFATGYVVAIGGSGEGSVIGDTGTATKAFYFDHFFNPGTCNPSNNTNCTAESNPTWFYDIDNYDGGGSDLDWDFSATGPWIMPQTGKYPVLRWQNPNDPIAFPPEFRDGRKIGFSDMGAYRVWGFCSEPSAAANITFTGPNAPGAIACNGGTWEVSWDFSGASEGNIDITVQQGTAPAVTRRLVKDTTSCDGTNDETTNGNIDTRFGGSAGPHIVCNVEQMDRIRLVAANHAKSFTLGDNIDLASFSAPIGDIANQFSGDFDGDNFVLNNLTVSSSGDYIGLFAVLTGTVQNLGLENVDVKGDDHVGALAGLGGNSDNIYSTGYVASFGAGSSKLGGLFGDVSLGEISNCFSTADIVASNNDAGGIGGISTTDITDCYASGRILAGNSAGGLIGTFNTGPATISRSFATGHVSAGTACAAGGLIGELETGAVTLRDNYATGSVFCASNSGAGGFVGDVFTGSTVLIENSYASGYVFGENDVGGFAGVARQADTTINDSLATGLVASSGTDKGTFAGEINASVSMANSGATSQTGVSCIGNDNAGGQSCAVFSQQNLSINTAPFSSWDFTTPIWELPAEEELPILK